MKKRLILFLFVLLATVTLVAGCGPKVTETVQSAKSDGKNCEACHTSRELILADIKADPIAKAVKSAETSGEG